jgi:UrcA family protein
MRTLLVNSAIFLSLVMAGLLTQSGQAIADQTTTDIEEIIVRAPMSVERQEVKNVSSSAMVTTEVVELKRLISFADLDLSREADVKLLEARIEVIAKDSCEKLSDMFPLDRSGYRELQRCAKNAIHSALQHKERAIAAAN